MKRRQFLQTSAVSPLPVPWTCCRNPGTEPDYRSQTAPQAGIQPAGEIYTPPEQPLQRAGFRVDQRLGIRFRAPAHGLPLLDR